MMSEEVLASSSLRTAIDSSNIGFKLLQKQGWKEGTGLGVYEQGRLEPVETHLKNNKRGLGAEKRKTTLKTREAKYSMQKNNKEHAASKKTKALSKKMRKMQELEKKLKEKEFERAFFREFLPDNV